MPRPAPDLVDEDRAPAAAPIHVAARPAGELPADRPVPAEDRPAPVHREACPSDRNPAARVEGRRPATPPAAPCPDLAAAYRRPGALCHPERCRRTARHHAAACRERHCQAQDHQARNRDAPARYGVRDGRRVARRIPSALVPQCADRVKVHLAPVHPPAAARLVEVRQELAACRRDVHHCHQAWQHHQVADHQAQPCPARVHPPRASPREACQPDRQPPGACPRPGHHLRQVLRPEQRLPEAFHPALRSEAHRASQGSSVACLHREVHPAARPQVTCPHRQARPPRTYQQEAHSREACQHRPGPACGRPAHRTRTERSAAPWQEAHPPTRAEPTHGLPKKYRPTKRTTARRPTKCVRSGSAPSTGCGSSTTRPTVPRCARCGRFPWSWCPRDPRRRLPSPLRPARSGSPCRRVASPPGRTPPRCPRWR